MPFYYSCDPEIWTIRNVVTRLRHQEIEKKTTRYIDKNFKSLTRPWQEVKDGFIAIALGSQAETDLKL